MGRLVSAESEMLWKRMDDCLERLMKKLLKQEIKAGGKERT